MNRRTKIMVAVNEQADEKMFYKTSQMFGTLAASSFQAQEGDQKKKRHRAQMTGLENIAETTLKVSDVLDYIKRQTARHDGWKKKLEGYDGKCFGEVLKDYIEQDLESMCERVCGRSGIGAATDEDKRDRQLVYLHLIRQLVRQLVVHYEYQVSEPERAPASESGKVGS